MTTKRQIDRMSKADRQDLLLNAAKALNSALNLYGVDEPPISDLLESESEMEMEARLGDIMTPECHCRRVKGADCDHAFPAWFVRRAQAEARAFARVWKQVHRL